jgi:hypothetical protein
LFFYFIIIIITENGDFVAIKQIALHGIPKDVLKSIMARYPSPLGDHCGAWPHFPSLVCSRK